MNQFQL